MRPAPDDIELREARKRAPIGGLFGEAEASASLDDPGPEEGARTVRHVKAIRDVEASGTPHETAIVERVRAAMVRRGVFTADDVSRALDAEGVADTLEVRRRYSSRVTNGIRNKVATGKAMTTLGKRSGREITVWEIIPE